MMSDFHFVHPLLMNLVWIVLILAVIAIWAMRRRITLMRRFADKRMLSFITPGASRVRPFAKAGLAIAAMCALVIAIMELGLNNGAVDETTSAIVISAGILASLLFPSLARKLLKASIAIPQGC